MIYFNDNNEAVDYVFKFIFSINQYFFNDDWGSSSRAVAKIFYPQQLLANFEYAAESAIHVSDMVVDLPILCQGYGVVK